MRELTMEELVLVSGGRDSTDHGDEVSPVIVEPGGGGGDGDGGGNEWGDWGDSGSNEGGGGANPVNVEVNAVDLLKYLQNQNWATVGINANEVRLKTFGAYNGEKIDPLNLNSIGTQNGITIYTYPTGDIGGSHVLYADRNGNGVIDSGVLYNPTTGILAWDYDADGNADEVVADLH